jgi:hypothetical protein
VPNINPRQAKLVKIGQIILIVTKTPAAMRNRHTSSDKTERVASDDSYDSKGEPWGVVSPTTETKSYSGGGCEMNRAKGEPWTGLDDSPVLEHIEHIHPGHRVGRCFRTGLAICPLLNT